MNQDHDKHETVARQCALEEEMRELGASALRTRIEQERNRSFSYSTAGQLVLKQFLEPFRIALADSVDQQSRRAGRRTIATTLLRDVPSDNLAWLTIKVVLDAVAKETTLTNLIFAIGENVREDMSYQVFQIQHPEEWKRFHRQFARWAYTTAARKRKVRAAEGFKWLEWSPNECAHVGNYLLETFLQSTGLVTTYKKQSRSTGHLVSYVKPSKKLEEIIDRHHDVLAFFAVRILPCVVPPVEWTGLSQGGFYTKSAPLVRIRSTYHEAQLERARLGPVYRAINALQNTSWCINKPVFDVLCEALKSPIDFNLPPPSKEIVAPEKPSAETATDDELKEWKRAYAIALDRKREFRAQRLGLEKLLWTATRFRNEPQIFFVWKMDFRGRVYPAQSFLQPQGDDVARGLLQFAKSKPLGTKGEWWLAIHGANCYGLDKLPLRERYNWVCSHDTEIVDCSRRPLRSNMWREGKKPWQFLAFSFEWSRLRNGGRRRESFLPVAMDGSCNGLQHFSAMLRDERGGRTVNLTPAEVPQDVYELIAERVRQRVLSKAKSAPDSDTLDVAEWWMRGEHITRSLCKKPVMTKPYGVEKFGITDQVIKYIYKHYDPGTLRCYAPGFLYKAAAFIAEIIEGETDRLIKAPLAVKSWLKECAEIACRENKVITWTNPAGFPFVNDYHVSKGRPIKTTLEGKKRYYTVAEETVKLCVGDIKRGISPNVLHSCDSAHMMRTVNLAVEAGIDSFQMIHDSYGTHAGDAEKLSVLLRQAFVEMYTEHDVLEELYEGLVTQLPARARASVPRPPERGDLDLNQVLESAYFFS